MARRKSRPQREGSRSTKLTDEEIEVVGILCEFPLLVKEYEYRSNLPPSWGSRKRRSTVNNNNPSYDKPEACAVGPTEEAATAAPPTIVKAEASSPATPLSFSPSESDERPKPSKRKVHSKRKKEEWLEIINDLTERRELLKREIGNVSCYYDKLKAFNLELKALKEELSKGLTRKIPKLEIGQSSNYGIELGQQAKVSLSSSPTELHHHPHPPLITDRAAQGTEIAQNLGHSANQVPFSLPSSGLVPDLNVSAEESLLMESFQLLATANRQQSKQMAYEARQRRIKICRFKNSISGNRIRSPC